MPAVQLITELVVELGLGDEERDPCQRYLLRLQNDVGKPQNPVGDIQRLLVGLKLVLVAFPVPFGRVGQSDQARLAYVLSEGFFGEGATEAAIAVLEGMDAFEAEMPKRRAG